MVYHHERWSTRTLSKIFKIAADRMLKNLGLKRATLHAGFSERSSPDSTFYDMKSGLEGSPSILPSCHGLECSAVVFGVGLFGYKANFPKSKTVIRSVLSSTTNPTWFSSAKPSRFHEIFLLVISIDVFSRPVMVLSVLLWSLVLVYSDTKQNFQNCD